MVATIHCTLKCVLAIGGSPPGSRSACSEETQGFAAMMGSKDMKSKSSSFHMPKQAKVSEVEADQQSQLQEGNELMQEAKLKLGFEYCHGLCF